MAKEKKYVIKSLWVSYMSSSFTEPMTLDELIDYYYPFLHRGHLFYQQGQGRNKVNLNPKTAIQLINALNNADGNLYSHTNTIYSIEKTIR